LAIAAPRGFGKSTLVTLACVLYGVCHQRERFIVILSATASQAKQFLETVKQELEGNQKLLSDFPELTGDRPSPWTSSEIVTPSHIRILALGAEQRIRGRKHGKDRPTLVIVDDVENAESSFRLDAMDKLRDWFTRSILKVGSGDTNYLLIGTLHHPHCLLAEYIDPQQHPGWTKRTYRAVTAWAAKQTLWDRWAAIYNSREVWEDEHGPEAARAFFEANRKEMEEGMAPLRASH